jgi:Mitochondrial carrier protein
MLCTRINSLQNNDSRENARAVPNPPLARSFLAGSLAHLIETISLGHLLDRIKVQQEALPHLNTTQKAVKSLLETNTSSWSVMYRGLRWNMALGVLKGAFGWTIHNFCNRQATLILPQKNPLLPSMPFTALVGCTTAIVESTFILCPLDRLKTFEMTDKSQQKSNIVDAIKKGGVRFVYRGWNLMTLRQGISWVSYLETYQTLRKRMLKQEPTHSLSVAQKILLGCGTGSIAACLNAPVDLIKTQAQQWDPLGPKKLSSIIASTFSTYGWKGMYNGLSVKLLRNAWSTTVIILTLDALNALPQNMRI